MKSIALALVVSAAVTPPVLTQEPLVAQVRTAAPIQPAERQPADERERTMPPPPPPAPAPPSERRALPTRNVKVDVTITDQTGAAAPVKKVVTVILADGRPGGVRSLTTVPLLGGDKRDLPLHVDATATVSPEQRVLLDLRFSYASVSVVSPVGAGTGPVPTTDVEKARDRDLNAPRAAFGNITENLSVLLTPNVPIVVARSADAAIDRTVTVEVKAEILK